MTDNLAANVRDLMGDILEWEDDIREALKKGMNFLTFNDVIASLLRGDRQFFKFDGCCFIAQLDVFSEVRAYHCVVACGTLDKLRAAEPDMTKAAKALGCKYFTMNGRVGWTRELKHEGWTHVLSYMVKELPDE